MPGDPSALDLETAMRVWGDLVAALHDKGWGPNTAEIYVTKGWGDNNAAKANSALLWVFEKFEKHFEVQLRMRLPRCQTEKPDKGRRVGKWIVSSGNDHRWHVMIVWPKKKVPRG